MKYILEYNKFGYEEGDEVLMHYWYSGFITPIIIKEKVGRKYLVSHNVEGSDIKNAPDELISGTEIIDKYRKSKL